MHHCSFAMYMARWGPVLTCTLRRRPFQYALPLEYSEAFQSCGYAVLCTSCYEAI